MGGSQSTRKLTLDNEDPHNVITISETVVDRIKGKQPEPSLPPQQTAGSAAPPNNFTFEPVLTPQQLRHQKEAELKKNDQYWQRRVNQLEESHAKMNMLMEQEYNNAISEVNSHFPLNKAHPIPTPLCTDNKLALLECYRLYPKEPMRCAQEVKCFAECVDKHRAEKVKERERS